jgi:N-acetylglucosaminyl-diphospho-decaprenol L-rhamnosyltransferase
MQAAGVVPGSRASRECVPLLVIIVNYRTPELTIDCLRSLESDIQSAPGARAVVVDNGSGDGSSERIEAAIRDREWGTWASLKALRRNGGFAFGNNRGMECVESARYVLLLNSDTVVHPGVLAHCRSVMDAEPTIGAMSCLVLNADGTPQNVARRFPTALRRSVGSLGLPWKMPALFGWADLEDATWDRRSTKRDVDWLGGAFLFVRGELVEKIGLLDEDFFFYGEDIEFCHRVWRAGYRCHYDPGASITHFGGNSSDPTRLASAERVRHAWRARHLVHEKLYGRASALACLALDGVLLASKLALRTVKGQRGGPIYRQDELALRSLVHPTVFAPGSPRGTRPNGRSAR